MQLNSGGIAFEMAFFLGALHALEPGHGKTALFAYMLDGGKRAIHAITMGIMSGLGHTASIIFFAFLAHLVSHVLSQGHDDSVFMTHVFTAVSGITMTGIGGFMLWKVLRQRRLGFTPVASCAICGDDHGKPSLLSAPRAHKHLISPSTGAALKVPGLDLKPKPPASLKVSAILGMSGGLIPCPSAVATYMSGMSRGDTTSALIAILFYAAGIMVCISAMGCVFSFAGDKASRFIKGGRYGRYIMYVQSTIILLIGLFYTLHSTYELATYS